MVRSEKRNFYVGINACGCVSASLVSDEETTPKEIAEFARSMHRSGRRMEHRSLTKKQFEKIFVPCTHTGKPKLKVAK